MALGVVVATSAPAQAAAPVRATVTAQTSGYTLYAQYFYQDECNSFGAAGVANGTWTAYYCTWTPITGSPGSGIYGYADLYVN